MIVDGGVAPPTPVANVADSVRPAPGALRPCSTARPVLRDAQKVGQPGANCPVGGLFCRIPGGAPSEASNWEKLAP